MKGALPLRGRAAGLRPEPASPSQRSSIPNAALDNRIEAATGPDRELDCRMWCGLGNADPETFFQTALMVVPDLNQWQAPRYTASIDAAMMLVPDGWIVHRLQQSAHKENAWCANLVRTDGGNVHLGAAQAFCATPALALCAAALKAKELLVEIDDHIAGEEL